MGSTVDVLRDLRKKSVGTEVGEYQSLLGDPSVALIAQLKLTSRLSPRKKAVLAHFITDMHMAIKEVSRVLAPGGRAIYVIGENTISGTYIRNANIIIALANLVGLKLKVQNTRTLPPNRRYLPPPLRGNRKAALNARMRREVVLQFVKPKRRNRQS
jgi:hypothetical protein